MATRFSDSFTRDLRYEPTRKRVRAQVGEATVLDTTRALLVWEPDHTVPKYAAPLEDLDLERLPAGSARECPDPDLAGHLLLDWKAFDRWLEEDDEVVGHPHDPFHRVDVRRSSRHVRVELDGAVLAESRAPTLVFETGHPVRFYFDPADVDQARLEPSPKQTTCAYKGHASYWSVRVHGRLEPDLAWCYRDPLPDCVQLRGLIAFFNERTDISVDGEPEERPHTQWS
ncbi:MAG TPA: DUF427 domain-containing protein [Thermoleophilaceae bacterium]